MPERNQFGPVQQLQFEIDSRIADLTLEALELDIVTTESAESYVIGAYQRGIEHVITEEHPDLCSQLGYNTPTVYNSILPNWFGDRDYAPTDDEIVEFMDSLCSVQIGEVARDSENLLNIIRAAYCSGYVYATVTHGLQGY